LGCPEGAGVSLQGAGRGCWFVGKMVMPRYFVYFTTNARKTVLYNGVTRSLVKRLSEHRSDSQGAKKSFAGKYNCINLIYYETFKYIRDAIDRETELKKWSRAKKEALIATKNPHWRFLDPPEDDKG
jgi:putative endonuclease